VNRLLGAALACLAAVGAAPARPAQSLRVLFVGNSLTYVNDLPALVEQVARADGVEIRTATVAFPDYSLADHLARGDAPALLARGTWDVVVLQQGPSGWPESRDALVASTRAFAAQAARVHARVALFGVWPAADRPTAFDSVTASYAAAADAVHGLLLPAGRAWTAAWRRDPDLPLYGPDGFHPAPLGSILAALVIYRGISGRHDAPLPATFTVNGRPFVVLPQQARTLEAAAEDH
jgi:hypothetical protein